MPARALILLANVYVVAYSLDAGLSAAEEWLRHLTGSTALLSGRNLLAYVVFTGSLFALPAMALTPRLPPSVIAPLALSALWMMFGAVPVPLLVKGSTLGPVLSGLQLAFAALAFLRLRALSGGRSWLLGHEALRWPSFSLRHTVVSGGLIVGGGAAAVLLYLPLWFLSSIQLMTDGFVRFDLAGVSLADRRFERGSQEVRLVGMMHIGEREAYRALVDDFAGRSTIVLAEGVTDREHLLRTPPSYEGVARALGLDTQDEIEFYLDEIEEPQPRGRPDVRRADVDLSDFDPDTIAWLGWAGEIWGAESPLAALLQLFARYREDPERWSVITEDVLTRRNLHLLEEIRGALGEYEHVIVPWGALHLPFVQLRIREMGFEPAGGTHHPLASWKTIARGLLATRAPGGPEAGPAERDAEGAAYSSSSMP